MPRYIEVRELRISAKTSAKIRARGIHPDELRGMLEGVGRVVFWWVEDDERGRRAYVPIVLQSREAVAVLYPALGELGTAWNLGSVYFRDE